MKKSGKQISILLLVILQFFSGPHPVKGHPASPVKKQIVPEVSAGKEGKLIYSTDSVGNRIPDFSYCGYHSSEDSIPLVPVKVFVPAGSGDATGKIQRAIDYVSSLPVDANGFRGAVLLGKGKFSLSGRLLISSSGIIIRGSGMDENGTCLIAAGKDRQTLVRILGKNDMLAGDRVKIEDAYVPVNANHLQVPNPGSFKAGDKVIIQRPSTQKWIDELGMVAFGGETGWLGWKAGQRDLFWYREIVSSDQNQVVLDAPITTSLDNNLGGGFIQSYQWSGRISHTGIENMLLQSEYDITNPKDEQHCWSAITFENAENCWVRQVIFRHFAGSAVAVYETARKITVEDCLSLEPVSETGGWRRNTFFTMGQQILFQRIYAEYGYHDFSTGFCACGPNAFVQCESHLPVSFSGAADSWASGVLFDIVNVDGQDLCLKNREQDDHGAGWCAASSLLWNCTASRIDCYAPPGAYNWAFGAWAQFSGNGYWADANNHISPRSLFYTQLADRLGKEYREFENLIMPVPGNPTTSPTIFQAKELNELAKKQAVTLKDFILNASRRNPVSATRGNAPEIDEVATLKPAEKTLNSPLILENGWIVSADKTIATGGRHEVPYWRGDPRPYEVNVAQPAITRFVPGRNGKGYTDNLDEVASWMKKNRIASLEHNYGLWYDRRRDDHERVRRSNGEAWAPFYELPFARSGVGTAWDGLSKYDLTKYNDWYWTRLREFSELADRNGLLLINHHYFQHNILEAGAHWADFPWRTANNINHTGFPEPPPYAGDKRIFLDEPFYDLSNPVRRELHRAYIRKCLENFSDSSGVLHLISAEYTGPLHFVRFWLDVISEWEQETGKHPVIGLSTTKDVQDSILADTVLSKVVDLIDIRYWSYRADGSLYAPAGGQHLAPRQHARLVNPGNRSFDQVYRTVSEYRRQYPGKAVIYSEGNYNQHPWAVFMAGGSLANLPQISDPVFLKTAAKMAPFESNGTAEKPVALGNPAVGYIFYLKPGVQHNSGTSIAKGKYKLYRIDPVSGKVTKTKETFKGGNDITLKNETEKEIVFWLKKD